MAFDLEKIRKSYKEHASRREAFEKSHNQAPESLARKLGYFDIDYSDSQLDSDEVIQARSKRQAELKKELNDYRRLSVGSSRWFSI